MYQIIREKVIISFFLFKIKNCIIIHVCSFAAIYKYTPTILSMKKRRNYVLYWYFAFIVLWLVVLKHLLKITITKLSIVMSKMSLWNPRLNKVSYVKKLFNLNNLPYEKRKLLKKPHNRFSSKKVYLKLFPLFYN